MVKKIFTWAFLVVVAVVLIMAQPVFAQLRMIDLGTLGGTKGQVNAINNAGQMAGISTTASEQWHAFFWSARGGMVDLGTLGNGEFSTASGINNSGQVIGESTTLAGDPFEDPTLWDTEHAFLWTAEGGMIDLGTLGGTLSRANAINDSGQVVGRSETASGESHAFLWTAEGGMVDLGTLGGPFSTAYLINNLGQVAGQGEIPSGEWHAFLWTAEGGMVDLSTLGGTYSIAYSINDFGQVIGGSETASGWEHAFFWTAEGGMVDLGTLGGSWSTAWCWGINNHGRS